MMALEWVSKSFTETEEVIARNVRIKLEPDDGIDYEPQSRQANDEMVDGTNMKLEATDDNCRRRHGKNSELKDLEITFRCFQDHNSNLAVKREPGCDEEVKKDEVIDYGPQSRQANDEMEHNTDMKLEATDDNCRKHHGKSTELKDLEITFRCFQDHNSNHVKKEQTCDEGVKKDDSINGESQPGQANDEMMDDIDIKFEPHDNSYDKCFVNDSNVEINEMDKPILRVQDSDHGSAAEMVKSESCNERAKENRDYCLSGASSDELDDYRCKKDKGYMARRPKVDKFEGSSYKVIKCKECDKRYLGTLISEKSEGLQSYICELCENTKDHANSISNRTAESGTPENFNKSKEKGNAQSDSYLNGDQEVLYKYRQTFAYRCEECAYTCSTERRIKAHLRTHKCEKAFKCELCQYACIKRSVLENHMRTHSGEKPYKCKLCQYTCTTRNRLKLHMMNHSSEKPYKCEVCQYTCTTRGCFKTHMRIHSGEKPYKCELCQYACTTRGHLKTHMRIHSGEKPYKCELCQHACTTRDHLKTHMRIHTGEKPYKCELCQFACTTSGYLKAHVRTHTGEKPYKCEVCQYASNHRSNLKVHMRTHSGEKPYKCQICQHAFITRIDLENHVRTHTGEKPYKCEVCQYTCTLRCNFKAHMRIHSCEKPFKCEFCQHACSDRRNFKKHVRTHEKTYKCELCQYTCTTSGSLKRHTSYHDGEKPYKCELCIYACTTAGHLKRHVRIHSGEKPYKCELCQYSCTCAGNLKRHMRIHSSEKP